ncbi:MAG: DNA translocase FtsK 4TM domain-containing protein [Solirubrobacteraceae bacterium]
MPSRSRTAKRSAPRRRGQAGRRPAPPPRPRLPEISLEPHHVDLIGLGLVALGLFLACVLYLDWSGGSVGAGMRDGLRWTVGVLAYAVPVLLVAGGAATVAREAIPAPRPLRAGAVCLAIALLLALAAGTLGLGPGAAPAGETWHRAAFEARSGALGAGIWWSASHLVSAVGAHILAVFLFLAGLILLSGATVAGLVRATRAGAAGAGRRLRDGTGEPARTVAGDPGSPGPAQRVLPAEPMLPPEPDTQELVVRATHVEAPSLDGASRYPDLYGADGEDAGDPDPADADETLAVDPAGPDAGAGSGEPGQEADERAGGEDEEEGAVARRDPTTRQQRAAAADPDYPWRLPAARILRRSTAEAAKPDTRGQEQTATALVEALGHFGVEAKVVGTVAGPHITRYELRLAPGTKVAKVAQLKDDLAYALAATDIRILAPIPGKQAVGVEVPNARRRVVHLGDVFQDPPQDWSPLTVWLGKDVAGRAIGADLAKMPHLLVAGTTGAGKSGAINAMLTSILLRATPREVRLVLVDPKQVELNHYEQIPHLLTPVITSPRRAANALANLVKEMEDRYALMSMARTRSLQELNRARESREEAPLPYVLCVIDELADLMMVAPADVEDSVIRLAQKARAVGIHLVLATQSPRVDVITGMIKANVPSRIAFAVSSQTDSRVILDQNGAESLLGQGDLLFSPVGSSKLQRIQGAYVDEDQIAAVTGAWRKQGEPEFREDLLEEVEDEGAEGGDDDGFDPDEDPLLEDAIALVAQMGTASTSMLQRRLRLGYTRAGRLIDMLERRGIISGYEGSKPRQVLVTEADLPRVLGALRDGRGDGAPEPVHSAEPGD